MSMSNQKGVLMSNVINFPKNKKWILNFIIPDEISMEGQSPDIHGHLNKTMVLLKL